ncbi:MAG TPA: SH3 domain-containing protein [Candidatus Faecousia faecavium]|nr:SH3 domain-containing protein [Candidatus Faecousia faecavium]
MKKRLVCLLLTLLMLVSLVPATALTASAATLKTSEKAITVLKQLESYSGSCDANGYTGYGTRCTAKGDHGKGDEKHKITQAEADAALRKELENLDKAINSFASKKGLTLNQQKHDAMVLFSFANGTAWVNGTGDLQAAITSGATGSKFLNAICWWNSSTADDQRRMVEANMYLNGVYSISKPAQFVTVTLKANGGSVSGTETRYYDTAKAQPIDAVVTNGSKIFVGWYLDKDKRDGNPVTQITQGLDGKTLYAHWQDNYNNVNPVYYQVPVSDLASKAIYKKVGGELRGDSLNAGDKDLIWIYKDFVDQNGVRWGRVTEDGAKDEAWVKFKTTVSGGTTTGDTGLAMDVTVTVTNSYLNSRANASIFSAQVGSYKQGDKLRIINTANADGFLWGQVAKSETDNTPVCWVALMYTNYESVKNQSGPDNSKVVAKATIRVNGYVNVRSDAGTDKQIVGALPNGTQVDLYETKYVNGIRWGRCKTGWFCLTYAEVSNLSDEGTSNDLGLTSYAFTGKMMGKYIYATPQATEDRVEVAVGTAVTVTNLTLGTDGNTWGKTSKGWVCLSNAEGAPMDVKLDIAKYVTTANTVTIRKSPSTDATRVSTLSKGVEFNVNDTHQIVVVGETIWGYAEKINVAGVTEGWVNLASKYVSRNGIPSLDEDGEEAKPSPTGKIATIINTDSVNVRDTGATYGKLIGKLSRGSTYNVLRENNGWYELDVDVDNNPKTGSWVYSEYLDVREGSTSGSGSSNSGNSGNSGSSGSTTVETGTGIVANTYTGVNIRTGPSTGYALVGKYLPGTKVEITEVKTGGASKWGKTEKGWVCMDYITMVSNYPIEGGGSGSSGSTGGSSSTTTESAIYTGVTKQEVNIRKEPDLNAEIVRTVPAESPVTIHEIVTVTEKSDPTSSDNSSSSVTTVTKYWARVNDGYIYNPGDHLNLDTLDEKTYTVTENDTLNVRDKAGTDGTKVLFKLNKGDQVTVTKLQVVLGNVWGFVECNQGTGWISLRYTTPGAVTIPQEKPTTPTNPTTPPIGDTGNTGGGGFVNNSGGYRYTGKVINTNELNVRSTASTNSSKTTTLKSGASLVIYETTTAENMAWGRCDAGWVYLYYVDLTPCVEGAVDARVVYQDNTIIYKDMNRTETVGTYARMSVVDIYEIVGEMARTDKGWVSTKDLL